MGGEEDGLVGCVDMARAVGEVGLCKGMSLLIEVAEVDDLCGFDVQ